MSSRSSCVAVLGAGNGGCAAAADLALRGFDVRLYSRSSERIAPILERGGIEITGAAGDGFARIALVTNDLANAVAGADVILLCVPTSALVYFAPVLAPLVRREQVVVLNPGHMGGSLYFHTAALAAGGAHEICVCETATLTYACRMQGPASVVVYNVVTDLQFAALPATRTDELYECVHRLFPMIVRAESILQTGLRNLNAVEHPAQVLLNAGRLEHTNGDFFFYIEGTTPSVARVIEQVDRERMTLADAIGVPTRSFVEYFFSGGYTSAQGAATGRVFDAMQHSEANSRIKGPQSLDHRYLHEDVGWGLVPWIQLAGVFGVSVPTMEALTRLAGMVNNIDYMVHGLTLEKMGLAGLGQSDIRRFVAGTNG
jgi:opine dehydrogenase